MSPSSRTGSPTETSSRKWEKTKESQNDQAPMSEASGPDLRSRRPSPKGSGREDANLRTPSLQTNNENKASTQGIQKANRSQRQNQESPPLKPKSSIDQLEQGKGRTSKEQGDLASTSYPPSGGLIPPVRTDPKKNLSQEEIAHSLVSAFTRTSFPAAPQADLSGIKMPHHLLLDTLDNIIKIKNDRANFILNILYASVQSAPPILGCFIGIWNTVVSDKLQATVPAICSLSTAGILSVLAGLNWQKLAVDRLESGGSAFADRVSSEVLNIREHLIKSISEDPNEAESFDKHTIITRTIKEGSIGELISLRNRVAALSPNGKQKIFQQNTVINWISRISL